MDASEAPERPDTMNKRPSPNDQRSDVMNPNNPQHQQNQDNRANQMNPEHPAHPDAGEPAGEPTTPAKSTPK